MSDIHCLILNKTTALSVVGMPYPDEHFEFEEIIGTTVIEKKRNGTAVNGAHIVAGVVGNAIQFDDGVYTYVELGSINEPCFYNMDLCTEGLTLTFWTDTVFTTVSVTAVGIGCGKLEERQGVRFEFGSGLLFISVRFSDETQVGIYSVNPPTGWLHHGVIVKKGQKIQYVLNGTLLSPLSASVSAGVATLGGSVRFGAHSEDLGVPESLPGKLDDVRLWKKAKCPEFVKYIYDMYKN